MEKVWQTELDELIEVLGIKKKPVAVTFTNDPVEMKGRNRAWICNALKQAAKGKSLVIDKEKSVCPGGSWHCGLTPPPPADTFRGLQWFLTRGEKLTHSIVSFHRMQELAAAPPTGLSERILIGAVDKAEMRPDLIIFLCNAQEMPVDQWQKIVDVNLSGPFYLIQAAIPHLLETDGAVVNVTSSAAFIGEAYAAAYCATKAGLNNLTKALAMEFTHKPIRFNAVAPGGMVTNIANAISLPEDADYELMRRYTGLRGTVELDDVADIILMLASDAGRGFHGACLSIDKGITAG